MGGVGLAIVSYFFLPAIVDDVKRIATIIPQILEEGGIGSPTPLEGSAPIEGELGRILDLLRDGPSGQGGALHTASLFFGGFLSFILILVLSFYFSAQERGLEGFIRLVAPIRSRGYIIDLWRRAQAKIGLWFQGQIVLSVLITVVAYLGLTIMGIESALLLAVIMGVFELIPVFGPIMASVPGIVIGYTEGIRYVEPGLTAALFVALFYTIIQQFESHLFYPLVMRKIIGLPPVLVIIALVVGAKMAGFLGVILSVPLTAVAMEYFGDVAREKRIYDDD
jgi:predicted PurR-regulated permease PerM